VKNCLFDCPVSAAVFLLSFATATSSHHYQTRELCDAFILQFLAGIN